MFRASRIMLFFLIILVGACSDEEDPIAPATQDEPAFAEPLLIQPELPGGIEGFAFLPPLGAKSPTLEGIDTALLHRLTVEICEWRGEICAFPLVRTISSTGGLLARLRVTERGVYWTLWNTFRERLRVGRTYRIRVLKDGVELGYADVLAVSPGPRGKDEKAAEAGPYRLVVGSILPISFVVPKETGVAVGAAGGTVELAEGAVSLSVPAGALSDEVLVTATPATNLPNGGAGIVPGTAWDLGPDGLRFAQPVRLSLRYDPALVPAGVDPRELRIHKVEGGTLVQQEAGRVDLETQTVSAEVSGFSIFVIFPRDQRNPEDRQGPELRSVEILNPATGTWGSAATFDVSGGDAEVRFRLSATDNLTGLTFLDVRYSGPNSFQTRFFCYEALSPVSGSDTDGEWECGSPLPRFSDAGSWLPEVIILTDRLRNQRWYGRAADNRLCSPEGQCLTMPSLVATTMPTDRSAPLVTELLVSLDGSPGSFGPSISTDVGSGGRTIYYGFRATDDVSGVGPAFRFDGFRVVLRTPSGALFESGTTCSLQEGSPLDGFWACSVSIPAQAASGTWTTALLRVPDRVGNGGWSTRGDWNGNATPTICRENGDCVASPQVVITSTGDGNPPTLQSLEITTQDRDVTTRLQMTDDISGVQRVLLRYRSSETTQEVECLASLVSGTPTNGEWACTITFSPLAALGQWFLWAEVRDNAGNLRYYERRPSDGYLCSIIPGNPSTDCRDFGDTDLILQALANSVAVGAAP